MDTTGEPRTQRCAGCGGLIDAGYRRCRLCEASARWRVERGLAPVAVHVMEHAVIGSDVHERLRWYKDAAQHAARLALTMKLATRLADWLDLNPDVLGGVDVVTGVPSMVRAATEPVIDAVPKLAARHRRLLVATRALGRSHDPEAFLVDSSCAGRRVLVIDDVFVSGATVLSAADALARAGADVTGVLVLARLSRAGAVREQADLFGRGR